MIWLLPFRTRPKWSRISSKPTKASSMAGCPGWPSECSKRKKPPYETVELVWVPDHPAVEANEFAHQKALALIYRATSVVEAKNQPLLTYSDITTNYRREKRKLPAPHEELTREQQTIYRQMQTEFFPHPCLLNRMLHTNLKKLAQSVKNRHSPGRDGRV